MPKRVAALVAVALSLAQSVQADEPEDQVLSMVNAARAQAGCPTLSANARLNAAARGHAKAMAEQNFFGHTGKNGSKFTARIAAQGYRYGDAAENIGMGYASAQKVMAGWMASAGHRQNILDCGLTETGIAVYYQANDKPLPGRNFTAKYYWVEVFARPK